MQCVAVTRGGLGDIWLFESLFAADEHPLIQFGDAICPGPTSITKIWSNIELVRMAIRLGDERLSSEIDGKKRLTEYQERLWNLLVSSAQRPPSDPSEVLQIISSDRKKTRVSGVTQRRHPNEESNVMNDETKTAEAPVKRPPPRTAKHAVTSVITFGKDAEGKTYGPQGDGTFYNAKRAGSAAADRFTRMKSGMTVQEALDAGVTRGDLNWDAKEGFIKIV